MKNKIIQLCNKISLQPLQSLTLLLLAQLLLMVYMRNSQGSRNHQGLW